MPVTRSCAANQAAVELDLAAGQRLRYTIAGDADVTFTLRDHVEGTLLPAGDSPGPHVREWPANAAEIPDADDVRHTLGMQFALTHGLAWKVELLGPGRSLLQTLKDCRYANTGAPDEYFDSVRIFITGRP